MLPLGPAAGAASMNGFHETPSFHSAAQRFTVRNLAASFQPVARHCVFGTEPLCDLLVGAHLSSGCHKDIEPHHNAADPVVTEMG